MPFGETPILGTNGGSDSVYKPLRLVNVLFSRCVTPVRRAVSRGITIKVEFGTETKPRSRLGFLLALKVRLGRRAEEQFKVTGEVKRLTIHLDLLKLIGTNLVQLGNMQRSVL